MKKIIALSLTALMLLCSACGIQNSVSPDPSQEPDPGQEVEREIQVNLDGYDMDGGVFYFTQDDGNGGTETIETGSLCILAAEGETIGDALAACDILSIDVAREGDTFEGWMAYINDVTTDEDGFENITSTVLPDTLYTTEELLALTVGSEEVNFVAKWAGIAAEDYYVSEAWDFVSTAGAFAFSANGGSMTFQSAEGEEFSYPHYTYWLEEGQALSELMGTEGYAGLVSVEKEGAQFGGWTLYVGDNVYWNDEPVNEDGMTSFLFDEDDADARYLLLENATVVGEGLSTEELCGMAAGDTCYFAQAIWN